MTPEPFVPDVCIVGDTHFGIANSAKFHLDVAEKFFDDLYNYMKKHRITKLIHLGDVWEHRRYIDYKTLRRSFEMFVNRFNEDEDIEVYIIVGNHCAYYKNTIKLNSPHELLSWTKFNIIDKPTDLKIGNVEFLLIPWICSENFEEVHEAIEDSSANFCCGHLDIVGFKMTEGLYSQDGQSPKDYTHFDHVFSGHYHIGSTKDNITYVGSPYQLNWNDSKSYKSVVLLDSKTGEWQKEYSLSDILFHKITEWDPDIETEEYRGKIVKVYIDRDTIDQYRFDKWVEELEHDGVHKVTVVEQQKYNDTDINDIDISKETLVLLFEYVDNYYSEMPEETRDQIKQLLKKFHSKAQNL